MCRVSCIHRKCEAQLTLCAVVALGVCALKGVYSLCAQQFTLWKVCRGLLSAQCLLSGKCVEELTLCPAYFQCAQSILCTETVQRSLLSRKRAEDCSHCHLSIGYKNNMVVVF